MQYIQPSYRYLDGTLLKDGAKTERNVLICQTPITRLKPHHPHKGAKNLIRHLEFSFLSNEVTC